MSSGPDDRQSAAAFVPSLYAVLTLDRYGNGKVFFLGGEPVV